MAKANRSNRRKADKFPSLAAQKEKKLDWENFNFLENMLVLCTVVERRVPEESGVHFSVSSIPEDKTVTILFRTDRKEDPLIRGKGGKRPDYMALYIKDETCLCTIIEMKGTDAKKLKHGIEQIKELRNRLKQEIRNYLPTKWQVEIQGLLLTPPNSQIPLKQLELLKQEIIILPLQYSHQFELFPYISKKNEKLSDKYNHAPRRKNDLNFIEKVIDLIHKTMAEKWEDEGEDAGKCWNDYVPKHLLPRLYGFELMMAPYSIAHVKIALKLIETGYQFKMREDEVIRIYLTNSLEPAKDTLPDYLEAFSPALAHEAMAAGEVKRNTPVTVVIGNPPYSNYGMLNKNRWILSLLDDYKKDLNEKKLNLDDDFIKFIRYAQWLLDQTGIGVMGYISNNTFIDGITHRRMRESLMQSFNKISILDLHGSSMKQESCPDGDKDENVFDIQQGVGIGVFVKNTANKDIVRVYHADLWGQREVKYRFLSGIQIDSIEKQEVKPVSQYYFFVPKDFDIQNEYNLLLSFENIFNIYLTGIDTKIDRLLTDYDPEKLASRISVILNPNYSVDEIKKLFDIPSTSTWEIERAKTAAYDPDRIVQMLYRPFDLVYTYYDKKVLSRARESVMNHFVSGKNIGLCFMRQYSYPCDYCYFFVTRQIVESRIFISNRGRSQVASLYIYPDEKEIGIEKTTNFTELFKGLINSLYNFQPAPEQILGYIYAVVHSPSYRQRYAEFLKIDFPRIPFTRSRDLFEALSQLGSELVSLHLSESGKLDKAITTFPVSGDNSVTKVGEKGKSLANVKDGKGRLYINKSQYFDGIPEAVWNFYIGGYQVCHKWLYDRKQAGRCLSAEDIRHYHRIVVALNETIRIMREIDETIEAQGGFPIDIQ